MPLFSQTVGGIVHNPDDYRHQKKELLTIITKEEKITAQSISFLAGVTGVPLVVLYTFLMEDMPEYEQFAKDNITRIERFYGR